MKKVKSPQFVLMWIFLLGTTSCVDELFIDGNGNVQSEVRVADGFNEIASAGDFQVTVLPGSDYSVEVSAESNLLPYIETDVVGNTLKIRTRGIRSLRNSYPIDVQITTPELKSLSLSGSGLIKTGSFTSSSFSLNISGSGNIDTEISTGQVKAVVSGSGTIFLQGNATSSHYTISGSGKIKSYNLEQNNCAITISGSGDTFVNASETIDANISGSGMVYYIGHPAIHTSISGSGTVVDKN